MRAPALLATALLCGSLPALASAPPRLEEARKLIDDLDFEAALKVLDAADKTEGNDRATVLEIWTLQGIAFGTLGKEAKTRDSFRKLLMLAPDSKLPTDVPPRVRTPFLEARAWAEANGPLTVSGGVTLGGALVQSVKVTAEKDILRLARTARFHLRLDGAWQTIEVPFSAGRAAAPVGRESITWWAEILSERKGELLLVGSAASPREDSLGGKTTAASAPEPIEVQGAPTSGGWRRPAGFVLLGGGVVAAGVGLIFGVQSASARAKLTNATRDDQGRVTGLSQAAAGPLEAAANTQASMANVLFGVGGALGAAGVVLVVLGPTTEPTVALSPMPGGVSVSGHF